VSADKLSAGNIQHTTSSTQPVARKRETHNVRAVSVKPSQRYVAMPDYGALPFKQSELGAHILVQGSHLSALKIFEFGDFVKE
jgi:hypothetical protein